jgi:hypothetical protein
VASLVMVQLPKSPVGTQPVGSMKKKENELRLSEAKSRISSVLCVKSACKGLTSISCTESQN